MPEPKQFSKEAIRDRLLRRAAALWGYDEGDLQNFDPLVRLLMEASAVELEKVGHAMQESESRMLEQLAALLVPDTATRPRPAWAIAQGQPAEALGRLAPENQFLLKARGGRNTSASDFYFSPPAAVSVVNAALRCVVTPSAVFELDEGDNSRRPLAELPRPSAARGLWLGLDVAASVESWRGFRFYFDWPTPEQQSRFEEHLGQTAWSSLSGVPLSVHLGFGPEAGQNPGDAHLVGGHLADAHLTDLATLWEKRFIYIDENNHWAEKATAPYPEEVGEIFGEQKLKKLTQPLLWLKVEFPGSFPLAGLENITVALNAFPVINRQLHRFTYRLHAGLNAILLDTDESYWDMHSVSDQQGKAYSLATQSSGNNSPNHTYQLRRRGVGRFDRREAKELLYQLTELLRDEQNAFAAQGEEFLAALLRELTQNLARMEQKLGTKRSSDTSPRPFLVIDSPERQSNLLTVAFWSTQAEAANGLPTASRLSPYGAAGAIAGPLTLLTRTTGGRPALEGEEHVHELRKNLLTHDRLLTQEDLRAYCQAELGGSLRKVEISTAFVPGTSVKSGFERCVLVKPHPAGAASDDGDWQARCQLLQTKINRRSSLALPVRVQP